MSESINIPGYRIERKLGQGGMAAVYLAIQQSFEREVALKIMSPLLNSDPSFTTRFIREARIVAHIHHASIVPVYDVGEYQPYHYLSMEYLPGGDLKQRILKGRCKPEKVVEFCIALCGALDVAHRKGFIHRDIKPENILFREDGTPVLTDFGIARALDRGASLTVAGMLVGTPSYMSPEQVKGVELDGRSDLYSLGIVCYEMLTGTVPFRADSTMSVALKHLSDPMPSLPADLAAYQPFIDRLTAKDRNDRYANGSEAVQALRSIEVRAATSEATILRPMPPELTAMLTGKTARPSRFATAMATLRSVPGRIGAAVSRRWSERPHVPGARTIWGRIPKPDFRRTSVRWIGAASAFVVIAAIATTVVLLNPSAPKPKMVIAGNVAQPPAAPPVAVPPVAPPAAVPVTEAPPDNPLPQDSLSAEVPPAPEAPADATPAPTTPEADAAAAAAARQRAAQERQRQRAAKQRLAEIQKENEEIARRRQEEDIRNLLIAARDASGKGNYAHPVGGSAADRYHEILKMRPDNAEARAGLQKIADLLSEQGKRAVAVGDVDKLRDLVEEMGRVLPDDQRLVDLQVSLANLEASPVQRSRREAAALDRANKHIQKAYAHLDRKPLNQRVADMATDEYDLAAVQMPQAPDLPRLKERIISTYGDVVRTEIRNKDAKKAQNMINYARRRKWMTPELEELESSLKSPPPEAFGAK